MAAVRFVDIIASGNKQESYPISDEIVNYLKAKGIGSRVEFTTSTEDELKLSPTCGLVVTLGGDGTVLQAARAAVEKDVAVLPVNLGTFGYITEIAKDEWKEAIDEYLSSEGNVSQRLMLDVVVERNGRKVFKGTGLNEAVVCSSGIAKVVNLQLNIDKTFAGNFRSDGMIVATPTGSTGYSLASGGPILEAGMKALIITPICPFTLSNRPVVTGDKEIGITVTPNQRTNITLTVDGQVYFQLEENDVIRVFMKKEMLKLLSSSRRNFTDVIREKLKWAGEMRNA